MKMLSPLLVASLIPAVQLVAADPSTLIERAQQAAKTLPRGGIVVAEQTGTGAPSIAVAGKVKPTGVPPEKIIFEIGSISKVFTGLLLAQAISEKKVKLDTTLRELMPASQTFADEKTAGITLEQLATHSSGLPRMPELPPKADPGDPFATYDRAMLDATIASMKLDHAPPFAFSYSNLGVGLLGDLLSRLYGKPWEDLVRERIIGPLGMKDTGVTMNEEQTRRLAPPNTGDRPAKPLHLIALAGAGSLRSTTHDMLIFGAALARPDTTPLKEAIHFIEQPRLDGRTGICIGINQIQGQPAYWFQGGTSGFASWISARSADAHVVSILINNNILRPQSLLMPAAPDTALADVVGVYDTGVDSPRGHIYYTFEERDHQLWHQITGQPFRQLTRHPSKADTFELKAFNAELQFHRESGKVTGVTLLQDGREIKATKLIAPPKP